MGLTVVNGSGAAATAPAPAPARGAHATSVHTQATSRHRAANQAQEQDSRRLEAMLQDRRERQDLKLDYADVLTEIARLAAQDHDYARAYWFDQRATAVRDCISVRVLAHRGCPSGGGASSPISCHVRGDATKEAGALVGQSRVAGRRNWGPLGGAPRSRALAVCGTRRRSLQTHRIIIPREEPWRQ